MPAKCPVVETNEVVQIHTVTRLTYQNHCKSAQPAKISFNEVLHTTAFMAINETETAVTGVINPDSGIYLFSMHNGIVDQCCKYSLLK